MVESNKQNAGIKKELSDLKSKVQVMTVVVNDAVPPTQQLNSISTMPPLKSTTIALPNNNKNRNNSQLMDTTASNINIAPVAVENRAESNIQNAKTLSQSPRTKSQTHVEVMARKLPGQMIACKLLFPLLENLISSVNNFRLDPVALQSAPNIYASNTEVGRPKDPISLSSSVFTPTSLVKQSIGSFTDKIATYTHASSVYMPKIQEVIIKILEIFRYSIDDCCNENFPVALLARYLTDVSNILLKHAPWDNSVEGMKRSDKTIKSSDIESASVATLHDKFDPVMHAIRFLNGVMHRLDSTTVDLYSQQNSTDSSYKANLDMSKFRDVGVDSHKRKHGTLDSSSTVMTSNDPFRVESGASFGAKVLLGFDMPAVSNSELRKHYISATGSIPKTAEPTHDVATNLPEHFLDNFEDLPSIFVDLSQDILEEVYYSIMCSSGTASGKLKATTNALLNETTIFLTNLLLSCDFCKISDYLPLVKIHDSKNSATLQQSDSVASLNSLAVDPLESGLQSMYPFVMSLLADEVCFNTVNMGLKIKLLNILALVVCKHDSLYDAFAESQSGRVDSVLDEDAESDTDILFIDTLVVQGLEIITNFTWYPDKLLDNSVSADHAGATAYSLVMYESVSYLLEIVTFITSLLELYGGKAVAMFFGIKFDESQMELDGSSALNVFNIHTCSDQDRNRISKSNFVYNICKIWTLAIKYCDGIRVDTGAGYHTKIDQAIIQIVIYSTKILYNIARSVADGNWHILSRICNEMLYTQLYRFANRQVPTALSECIDYIESVDDIQILYCS